MNEQDLATSSDDELNAAEQEQPEDLEVEVTEGENITGGAQGVAIGMVIL